MAKDLKKGTMPLVSEQVNPSEHAFTWLGLLSLLLKKGPDDEASRSFLLKVIQPGLSGLMDGSVSTLAPIFATAFASHQPFMAFLVGLASATGAGISHSAWGNYWGHDVSGWVITHAAVSDTRFESGVSRGLYRRCRGTCVDRRHSLSFLRHVVVGIHVPGRRWGRAGLSCGADLRQRMMVTMFHR